MAPVVRRKKRKDEIKITVSPFRDLADYKACEDIQREVWHLQDAEIIPTPLLMVSTRSTSARPRDDLYLIGLQYSRRHHPVMNGQHSGLTCHYEG